ncbi:MAG: PIN domain-containing protein [Nitrospira sp.]|nr:PIN domain-containing protein [Nitrospira sp.]
MREVLLLDTGPLVAFLNRTDRHHEWATDQFDRLRPPLLTCEAVLAEACYLLRHHPGGSQAVVHLLDRGVLQVGFDLEDDVESVVKLMGRYETVPMSLADACLVRMAEGHAKSRLLTLDGDFRIYRKHRRQMIPTIMPQRA